MSKHHDDLAVQLELFIGIQKELKDSFEVMHSNWQNGEECSYLNEIDRWEEETLQRIRQVAGKARLTANEMMAKNMSDIRRRLDQLAFDIEQRQEEGNYLDNDIIEVKKQLEQLNDNIKHVHEKIRVNYAVTNKIDWDSLIYVTSEKKHTENRFSLAEFQFEQDDQQENLWTNFRKLIRNKPLPFKRNATSVFEPIVLPSYDSSTCPTSQRTSYCSFQPTMLENFQSTSDSSKAKQFVSLDTDRHLPQASNA